MVDAVLSNTWFWGEDLTEIPDLCKKVTADMKTVEERGAYELMKGCIV